MRIKTGTPVPTSSTVAFESAVINIMCNSSLGAREKGRRAARVFEAQADLESIMAGKGGVALSESLVTRRRRKEVPLRESLRSPKRRAMGFFERLTGAGGKSLADAIR